MEILHTINLIKAKVPLENVDLVDTEKRNSYVLKTPTTTFPFLVTDKGNISESRAIQYYLCEKYKPEFLGENIADRAKVNQWCEFASCEICNCVKDLVYPIFGWKKYCKQSADNANNRLKTFLKTLDKNLASNEYICGNKMTIADVLLFRNLRFLMMLHFPEQLRKTLCPSTTKWFEKIMNTPEAINAYGRTVLCKIPQKGFMGEIKRCPIPIPTKKENVPEDEPKKVEETKKETDQNKDGNKKYVDPITGKELSKKEFKKMQKMNNKKDDKNETGGKKGDKKGDKKANQDKKKDVNPDEDISSLGIQNKKEENFSDWYSECITKSEMIDYYDISGCYILRPWSFEIWEAIQEYFDNLIKDIGVQNYNFPLFVSQKALYKEKEHVEGFSPEVAWVTKSGKGEIDPPIAVRPTSETIMYPAFAKWIRSHRDLPLLANQWTNIVRWEFKNPTPFIRTREFLWQEGHTVHATFKEAEEMVYKILEYYRMVYEDLLACPVIPGIKSENEKFPGGFCTTSIEGLLPNGKGVQAATSHHLGQNFSKMFEITFLDKEKNKQFAWQTSWGLTTRSIGILVMMHGDNKGLVLPPKIAPIQVVIVPIKTSKDDPKYILGKGEEIYEQLKSADIKVTFDDSEMHTPGWKYAEWELKGVPIRIEYGKKDLSKDQVTFFCRDNLEKFTVKLTDVVDKVKEMLDVIQKRMFQKQKERVKNSTTHANDFKTFLEGLNKGHIVYTPWCKDSKCEDNVKDKVKEIALQNNEEDSVGTCKTLNMPLDQPKLEEGTKCFSCGNPAKATAIWGRSY